MRRGACPYVVAAALVVAGCAGTTATPPTVPATTALAAATTTSVPTAVETSVPTAVETSVPTAVDTSVPTAVDTSVPPVTTAPVPDFDTAVLAETLAVELGYRPAFGAALVRDGEVIWEYAAGQRIAGEAIDTDDRFRIASLAKPMTAAVVLGLVDEGRVGLDQPVGQLLADHLGLGMISPEAAALTPADLLSHTGGIPQQWGRFFGETASGDWRATAADGLRSTVRVDDDFEYSNMNYVLAGVLIEALTGQPYKAVVNERLLAPLGIDGMRMVATHEQAPDLVHYDSGPGRRYLETLGPAGGWVASAREIALVVDALDPNTRGWQALSVDTLWQMRTPRAAGPLRDGWYGLGVMGAPDGSIGHTGSVEQARAMAMTRPDGLTWVVLVVGEQPARAAGLQTAMETALAAAQR